VVPIAVPSEGLSAPQRAPSGQQIRVAAPRGDAVSFAPRPETNVTTNSMWDFNFGGMLFGNANGPRARGESDYIVMAIPFAFGGAIAVAVAAKRRRQKRQKK
jgi:hypothetical protein